MGRFVLLAILLLLLPNTVGKAGSVKCIQSEPHRILQEWHKPGDIFIGGVTSHIILLLSEITFTKVPSQDWIYFPILITKFIQHILALVFAIDEINENHELLPNVTLGFHIHDSYTDSRTTFRATLDLLSKSHQFLPNYKCGSNGKLAGVIGGLSADTSLCMEEILGLYKVPQKVLAFEEFLQKVKPSLENGNSFINNFWENAFSCSISNSTEIDACTGEEMLQNLPTPFFEMSMTGHSYSIYNAVYAMAHALDMMYSSNHRSKAISISQDIKPWQLHSFLQKISFNNSVGDEVTLNEQGEVTDGFDLINLVTFPNGSYAKEKVGRLNPKTPLEKEFVVADERIQWHGDFKQVPPTSLCNDPCQPGFHKVKKESGVFCCYDCLQCEEEKISYLMDMDDCISCPKDHYAKDGENVCIPKVIHFLSYKEPLGITLTSFTISLSLTASFVLGVFIKHQHTPIVKANNQGLSYSLLVSLILSFLCAFFFFDRPIQMTCLLRQTSLGIIFSVAISCILAKTIMVILAFLAIQPHSKMSKWVGRKLPVFIVLSCSLVQAGILATWLGTSPPFPDVDMHTLEEEIVLECNEGSTEMFYCVLGYMGFLSIVSFFVAFLAKNLPDSFNEAKFIIFSMLVFFSVWLSFVPTYMSTKGKYMVIVEVFSILASSTGLLSCIFFPKCYVILLRPDLNRREQLIKKKK
ncbi:vomeronasal type-2 receptor 26-like [Thamnophis elegans]|uniref:vomeronasal type-2 receptor 26-like n=1 Tax=Thamnophis elegans TaxID=35005 RepID=UPI001377DEE2|nr:vomeronasal type-2 receptor 26-like [Thamnophis elegans]